MRVSVALDGPSTVRAVVGVGVPVLLVEGASAGLRVELAALSVGELLAFSGSLVTASAGLRDGVTAWCGVGEIPPPPYARGDGG